MRDNKIQASYTIYMAKGGENMEKRSTKIIAIVALFVAVVGLSLGFAAFSSTLTISSSATVNPDDKAFNVDFSIASTSIDVGAVDPVLKVGDAVVTGQNIPSGFSATSGTISNATGANTTDTLSNLSATFTAPGQSVEYHLYVVNSGEYVAYLNEIAMNRAATCEKSATNTLVEAACESITLTASVAGDEYFDSNSDIDGKSSLATRLQGSHEVIVTISYDEVEGGLNRADESFTATFQPITLTYGSVD